MIKFRRVTNNTLNRLDLELIYMSLKINRINRTPVYSIVNSLYMTLFHRFALQYNLNIDFIFIFRKYDIVVVLRKQPFIILFSSRQGKFNFNIKTKFCLPKKRNKYTEYKDKQNDRLQKRNILKLYYSGIINFH